MPEDVGLALRLLRAVNLVSRDWILLADDSEAGVGPTPLVPHADFVNAKLASKLTRQLQVTHPRHAP
jgi:hypothetical protein